jgi:hypothetical protein
MSRGHTLDLRWNALLGEFRRSGLTQAEFCQRRGISLHSFRKHLYRVPASNPTASPARHPSSDGAAESDQGNRRIPDRDNRCDVVGLTDSSSTGGLLSVPFWL